MCIYVWYICNRQCEVCVCVCVFVDTIQWIRIVFGPNETKWENEQIGEKGREREALSASLAQKKKESKTKLRVKVNGKKCRMMTAVRMVSFVGSEELMQSQVTDDRHKSIHLGQTLVCFQCCHPKPIINGKIKIKRCRSNNTALYLMIYQKE